MKSQTLPTLALAAVAALALLSAAPADAQIFFDAQLSGAAEVPPVTSSASGSCVGHLDGFPTDPSFEITCEHNLEDAVAAHIHAAAPGISGGIVFPFADPQAIDDVWEDITVDEAVMLLAGGMYVNVHSTDHPNGEIRGQLRPRTGSAQGVETVVFTLSGDQEVPAVDTEATGVCVAMVELGGLPESGTMDLFCTHDVVDPTDAHIHQAAAGVSGDVVIPFDDPSSPIILEDIPLNFNLADALRNGDLYVNVHTAANPTGEIRGQIAGCFSSPTVLCLEGGRYAVSVDWQTTQSGGGSGPGFAVPETDDTGMFWFFAPSNLELMIKVLDACTVNERTWVFFAGLTNVGFDLHVTDTQTGTTLTYSNEDETFVEPVLDASAFDNCV